MMQIPGEMARELGAVPEISGWMARQSVAIITLEALMTA
jgi:hypothetical protein